MSSTEHFLIPDVMVNDAMVTDPDIFASNGFIHAISQVLMPDDIRPARY